MNNREALERIAAYPNNRSEEMSIETAREIARAALASQAQAAELSSNPLQLPAQKQQDHIPDGGEMVQSQAHQTESKQGCKECDGQTYMHSQTGEYLGECPYCTKEQEPYAYDVPTEDGTELAYAGYYGKYKNKLPEGAIPLYLQLQAQQESQWMPIETAPKNKKIIVRYKNVLGKDRTVFAKYLDKFTEEASEGTDCETDYCETDDTFYLKEGWVELIDNWEEFSSVYFDSQNVPTHWMDIPPAPEGDKP